MLTAQKWGSIDLSRLARLPDEWALVRPVKVNVPNRACVKSSAADAHPYIHAATVRFLQAIRHGPRDCPGTCLVAVDRTGVSGWHANEEVDERRAAVAAVTDKADAKSASPAGLCPNGAAGDAGREFYRVARSERGWWGCPLVVELDERGLAIRFVVYGGCDREFTVISGENRVAVWLITEAVRRLFNFRPDKCPYALRGRMSRW